MSEERGAEKDAPTVDALADLIDHWWDNADQPTMRHDGVEYVASLALARFLLANGCSVSPPGPTDAYERGQRDLAAKVEAVCDRADGSASDDADVRGEIGEAWIKVRDLRALLADALPQDADSEPASVPLAAEDDSGASMDVPGAAGLSEAQETCGLEFGDGYTCDLPKGHDEDETRDGEGI